MGQATTTSSIIASIMGLAAQAHADGGGPKFIACLSRTLKERFDKEAKELAKYECAPEILTATSPNKDPVLNGSGFRVRVVLDPFVPLGRIWVIPEYDIESVLKCMQWISP